MRCAVTEQLNEHLSNLERAEPPQAMIDECLKDEVDYRLTTISDDATQEALLDLEEEWEALASVVTNGCDADQVSFCAANLVAALRAKLEATFEDKAYRQACAKWDRGHE